MAGHDDVAEIARATEVALRCEIEADTTEALNANWGKIHNPWEHARPRQDMHWGEGQLAGQRQFQDICMWTGEFNIGVVHTFICEFLYVFNLYRDIILFGGSSRYPVRDGVHMLREVFAGALFAHLARM